MIAWQSAGDLTLDRDGTLWLWTDPGYRRLGPIEAVAGGVAEDLAEDLAGDAAELLDAWRDGFDDRAERGWDHRLAMEN